jgi:hypothetical protein
LISGIDQPNGYNPCVNAPLTPDTSHEIEARQISSWREMSPSRKAELISALSRAARDLALAGVRYRHPNATSREQFLRLAVVTLGPELARRAYPEIESLDFT